LLKAFDELYRNSFDEENGYSIVEISNQLSTPLHLIRLIVYNSETDGTVGEIQMKMQTDQIPPATTYMDQWLYDMRNIFENTDNSNPKDWTSRMKQQRTKLFTSKISNLVLEILGKEI